MIWGAGTKKIHFFWRPLAKQKFFTDPDNSKSPLLAFLQHPFGCLVGSGVASCTLKGRMRRFAQYGAYSGIRRIVA